MGLLLDKGLVLRGLLGIASSLGEFDQPIANELCIGRSC